MDKTDRLRDYGLAFLLYKQGLSVCGYELIRELFIFIKLILNSYLVIKKRIKMKKFESLDSPKFNKLEVESMKRLKGGYTLNTVTVYSSGNVNDDGNACQDGVCND